jgi:hypothetical protein
MIDVLVQMAGLILCGILWRVIQPGGLDHLQTRKVLTTLVYYLLLPALVLSVLWQTPLGGNSVIIAVAAAAGILVGLLLSFVLCRLCKTTSAQTGALILAATFPNATYLGLPVMEAAFGPWARSVAIQYDLFACTPLLFSLGVLVAARFGSSQNSVLNIRQELFRIPALWAALVAVILNLAQVPLPQTLNALLELLQRGVVPLMLFSLGLSLQWQAGGWRLIPRILPAIGLRLLVIPALVLLFCSALGLQGELRAAVVMIAAMPSMVIGLVLCDRFNLDVSLYATAVTVTTVVSMLSLPLWYGILL